MVRLGRRTVDWRVRSFGAVGTAALGGTVIICVPEPDPKPWPTLGREVCDWIETHLVHGPGDLRGMPARLDEEKRGLIYSMYEVHPELRGKKPNPLAGRRRFKRACISVRKGSAKTELLSWVAIVELLGPARCVGWKDGQPIGGPVNDPYIPLLASTEEQSEELAYGAVRVILGESKTLRGLVDIGLERCEVIKGGGKVLAVATAPNQADGARTTFNGFDETHRLVQPRHKAAHRTMLANVPKRKIADAWSMETTTSFGPGEGSVAEDTYHYAEAVRLGKVKEPTLFFFHRQASDGHDLDTKKGLMAAVLEASGPVAEWSDLAGILDQWKDPTADRNYLERVWLNRPTTAADVAFDSVRWGQLADSHVVPRGAWITLGFDGSRSIDATALIGTEILTGYQWVLGLWERPGNVKDWKVPIGEVNALVAHAFEHWSVWRMYADPPYWEDVVSEWCGKYNPSDEPSSARVVKWYTSGANSKKLASAVLAFANAISNEDPEEAALSHDGNTDFARHVANAYKRALQLKDEKGQPMWTLRKERPDSPKKIDAAMAAILSWQARCDARALGIGDVVGSVYAERFAKGEEVLRVL